VAGEEQGQGLTEHRLGRDPLDGGERRGDVGPGVLSSPGHPRGDLFAEDRPRFATQSHDTAPRAPPTQVDLQGGHRHERRAQAASGQGVESYSQLGPAIRSRVAEHRFDHDAQREPVQARQQRERLASGPHRERV